MKKKKIGKFHYHEALDRSFIVGQMIDSFLINHPVIRKHKKLRKKVERAATLIYDTYQEVGNIK